MPHDVFISYSSVDRETAETVLAALEDTGLLCWIAPRDILPGQNWIASIIDAINESRVMVLIFSASANASPQVEREIARAVDKRVPIVPFRIEDVPMSKALEYLLGNVHWLDASNSPVADHLDYLVETVQTLCSEKLTTPVLPPNQPAQGVSSPTVIEPAGGLGKLPGATSEAITSDPAPAERAAPVPNAAPGISDPGKRRKKRWSSPSFYLTTTLFGLALSIGIFMFQFKPPSETQGGNRSIASSPAESPDEAPSVSPSNLPGPSLETLRKQLDHQAEIGRILAREWPKLSPETRVARVETVISAIRAIRKQIEPTSGTLAAKRTLTANTLLYEAIWESNRGNLALGRQLAARAFKDDPTLRHYPSIPAELLPERGRGK